MKKQDLFLHILVVFILIFLLCLLYLIYLYYTVVEENNNLKNNNAEIINTQNDILQRVRLLEEENNRIKEEMKSYLEIKSMATRIDNYLARRGSPLAGYGKVFVLEGRRTGINPYLSVAIAGAESTFGLACFAPHNAWGMLAYRSGFSSWEEGIRANFNWLQKYFGKPQSAYDCPGYCVPNHPWMERVQAVIEEI